MTDITQALFVAEAGGFRPTAFALGPWTPEHLHGGPVAGLIAREAQLCEPDERLRVARLTIELIRPVSSGADLVGGEADPTGAQGPALGGDRSPGWH